MTRPAVARRAGDPGRQARHARSERRTGSWAAGGRPSCRSDTARKKIHPCWCSRGAWRCRCSFTPLTTTGPVPTRRGGSTAAQQIAPLGAVPKAEKDASNRFTRACVLAVPRRADLPLPRDRRTPLWPGEFSAPADPPVRRPYRPSPARPRPTAAGAPRTMLCKHSASAKRDGGRVRRSCGWWAAVGARSAGCQRSSDSAWVTVWASNSAGSKSAASLSPSHSSMSSWPGWVGSVRVWARSA